MDDRPRPTDVDKTEELAPPPPQTDVARPPRDRGERRPAERWSTVFTVFAAIALVALLLLGAAVIPSQPLAAPSAGPSDDRRAHTRDNDAATDAAAPDPDPAADPKSLTSPG